MAAGFGGGGNIDMSRFARENQDPALYLRSTYYERWLHGLQTLLVERGHVSEDEIERRMSEIAARESAGEGG